MEREVDIRKRVGEVFNRRQDEFETLLDWNNYLEEVEGLVFDLVEGSVKERTKAEGRLAEYRAKNLEEIEGNKRVGQAEVEMERRREKAEKDAARQRRLAVAREMEEEKMNVEKGKRDLLEKLATSDGHAEAITRQAQKVILKKSSARRNVAETAVAEGNGSANSGLTIRGLKKKVAPVVEKAYDPFGGVDITPERYTVQESYDNEWLGNAKKDSRHMAGGYSLPEYYARTMFEAFSGLGVFIEEEVGERSQPAASSTTGTAAAAQVAGANIKLENKMELDDVF